MNYFIGTKTLFLWDMLLKAKPYNVKMYIETYNKVSIFQISWHKKGGSLKTIVRPHLKFPYTTTINGVTYNSDKIESVINLVK